MKRLEDMTEPELSRLLNKCAYAVTCALQDGVSPPDDGGRHKFVLVVFDDPKVAQYVSGCTRQSMIEAICETAERLKNKQDVTR